MRIFFRKNLNPLCFFSSLCYKRQSHAQSFIIRSCSLSFIIISNMTDFFICSYLPYSVHTYSNDISSYEVVCYSIHTGSLESRQSLKFQSYSIAAQNRYLINVAPAHSFVRRKDVCALRKYVCAWLATLDIQVGYFQIHIPLYFVRTFDKSVSTIRISFETKGVL